MTDYWASVLPSVPRADWMSRVSELAAEASMRRSKADYNTGSIAWMEAYQLCALANHLSARVVIEVGTFVGTSTYALSLGEHVEAIYTCDSSNNCCPNSPVVHTHPFTKSTVMLARLRTKGVVADLCFFDGHLSEDDAAELQGVTHPGTVYAFHDYNYGPKIRRRKDGTTYQETLPRKGIGGVALMSPLLPGHRIVEPIRGTTLALLVPR